MHILFYTHLFSGYIVLQVALSFNSLSWRASRGTGSRSATFFFPPLLKIYLFILKNLFIYYLFLAALGLCCYAWVFSSCGEQGLLFVAVHGLLIVVASLVAEHRL